MIKKEVKCLLYRKIVAMIKTSMNNYKFLMLFLQLLQQFFEINKSVTKSLAAKMENRLESARSIN